ncbi:recombinase family protein [Azospirillum isscasi]|uniref:Recombinase family protein n=1 Tax=Azospirillum isscasi TaxID=3053926 RepID=A0ABU0WQM6_9PROT|nr:recombinase family protein [Azospirillum isscasi]MDQ2106481.1 recombinase family protein [Azospirillum isscasi]
MGRLLGYARVSTDDQDMTLQLDALRAAGVADVDLFTDHGVSGAQTARPGLDRLLSVAVAGDVITVWRLDRLGRSVVHLATLAEELRGRGVGLRSLTDGVDTSTATGRLVYGLLSTLAEFERETIRERVKAGMQAAKKRGVSVGRRKALTTAQAKHARALRAEGRSCAEVAALLGVDRTTVWRATR